MYCKTPTTRSRGRSLRFAIVCLGAASLMTSSTSCSHMPTRTVVVECTVPYPNEAAQQEMAWLEPGSPIREWIKMAWPILYPDRVDALREEMDDDE